MQSYLWDMESDGVCGCQVFFGINIVASAHWPRLVGGVVTIGDQVTVLREGAKEIEMVEEGNETRESSVGDKVGSGDGVAKE